MKIDRIIGILSILLQQEKVTAPFLAGKFEVSRRTINRDIEDICKAGIPIVTTQGQNGGISIMDGYHIDRTLLTSSEMHAILTGLKSLDSVCQTRKYSQLMDKLDIENSTILSSNSHILIDLSSWYKTTLIPKIELIQAAIEKSQVISFLYYSPKGVSRRTIEPYRLVFQWASWYVWGYCMQRGDYRLFKLNRAQSLLSTHQTFVKRDCPEVDLSTQRVFPALINVTALFEPQLKWRVVEEYGIDALTEQQNGKLLFQFAFTNKENLLGWLLSFGDQVELIEPKALRSELYQITQKICEKYNQ